MITMQVNAIRLAAGVVFSEGNKVKKGPPPVSRFIALNIVTHRTT